MMITFVVLCAFMSMVTRIAPMEPRELYAEPSAVELTPARFVHVTAGAIVLVTVGLDAVFF